MNIGLKSIFHINDYKAFICKSLWRPLKILLISNIGNNIANCMYDELNKKRSNNYRLVYWKGPNICKGIPKFLLRQYDPNLIRGCDTCFYNQFILGLTNERT